MTGRIIKSEKQEQGEGGRSSMLIHLSKQYCFDWTFAFEYDLIASFLAISQTAEIKTEEGGRGAKNDLKAWIDSSNGTGELETNDPDYVRSYLKMPDNVLNMHKTVTSLHGKLLGYFTCWHPVDL